MLQVLDLRDLKNLRLTCRYLAEQCVGPSFKRFLELQTTDLSEDSILSLLSLATHSFGKYVKTLRIIALVYDTWGLEYFSKLVAGELTRYTDFSRDYTGCLEEYHNQSSN